MKFVTASLMACLLIGLLATAAMAGQGKGACANDVAALCKGVQPGGGRLMACLKEHEGAVSGACREHLVQLKNKVQDARKACQDDVEQFCSDVQPGRMRIVKCLKQHQAELSTECREDLGHRKMP